VRLPEKDAPNHGSRADIERNDANEANCDENVIAVQNKEPVEVTTNSGPELGLDNVADQPREDGEREGGEIQEVGTLNDEIGGPKPEIRSTKSEIRSTKSEIRSTKSEIRKSKSETANPGPEIENSTPPGLGLGGRVGGGRKRKASAKREMKRARREKGKKELERRFSKGVEVKAGEVSAGKLNWGILASSPSVSEIPRPQLPRSP
jgi:hypothetical protein